MRLIDADALLDHVIDIHCKNCERRKGVKNGKYRIIYEVGDVPCRSCGVDDMTSYLEDAPTVEPQQWIPVTERLPIPNERIGNVRKYYLIQNEYGDMMVACYNGEWEQIYGHEYCLDKVVAWMPLPMPWEGGEEDA